MPSSKYLKYLQDAHQWGLSQDDVELELAADKLLIAHRTETEKEYPCRTTEAEVTAQRRRPQTCSYSDYTPAPSQFHIDPDEEARQALARYGTPREQQVWHLFMTLPAARDVARELGITQAGVSRTIRKCREKIRRFHRTYASWVDVFTEESRRYTPPSPRSHRCLNENIEEHRRIIEEACDLETCILPQDMGATTCIRLLKADQRPEDDGVVKLTAQQLQTLAERGEVKTVRGLITLASLKAGG